MTDVEEKGRASEDLMDQLHGMIAEKFIKLLKEGTPSAAEMAQIRQFLKDNHIDAPRMKGNKIDLLAEEMPELEDNILNFG